MSKIIIIGAGAMGSAFATPCLDNRHDINIIGTHLENDFIDNLINEDFFHPGLGIKIEKKIKLHKFESFTKLFDSSVDLIVLGVSSKGIEWVSEQLSKIYIEKEIPNLLMLTKGLSIHNNEYELLVDKLKRLFKEKGISKVNISAVGGPCLATGLVNKVHSSVVIANENLQTAKKIADMLNTDYYHTSFSDDINGVEVSAAIKNMSMFISLPFMLLNETLLVPALALPLVPNSFIVEVHIPAVRLSLDEQTDEPLISLTFSSPLPVTVAQYFPVPPVAPTEEFSNSLSIFKLITLLSLIYACV